MQQLSALREDMPKLVCQELRAHAETMTPDTETCCSESCTTIFVGNLELNATEQLLRETFETLGSVRSVRLLKDKKTGKSKQCAVVQFLETTSYFKALKADGMACGGRLMRIE